MLSINDAIEWIYGLPVGVIGHGPDRHERPHKPVLLLAVLDLIQRSTTANAPPAGSESACRKCPT